MDFETYLEHNRDRFIKEFREFIAIPSVVAQKRGIDEAADWLVARLEKLGATVQRFPLPDGGSPVLLAEIGAGEHTLMVYNHYDVQPETPAHLWNTPPFDLTIKDGVMYGRGVADDKGELLSRLQAVEAWLATQGELPIKLKFVYEGEEEIGSVHLPGWVESHHELLGADGVLWEGGGYDEAGRRQIHEGCKGIAYFELRCKKAAYDLHSSVAPIVENPAWRLVWALSTMKDAQDRITIDNYMEHVRPINPTVLAQIDALPFEAEKIRQNYGLDCWINDMEDREAFRRLMTEPTFTVCGFESGYTDAGSKTVLPSEAMVKIDCRLVPDLTPELVQNLMRQHLDARGFTDIEIEMLGGERPAMNPQDSLLRRATVAAITQVFDQTPTLVPWYAGSGPMYPLSVEIGVPAVAAGATWHPGARAHAPNENIYLNDYFHSMRFMAALIDQFANIR